MQKKILYHDFLIHGIKSPEELNHLIFQHVFQF